MCKCADAVDAELAAKNGRLAFGFTVREGRMELTRPLIQLEKLDGKKRGKLPSLVASYCPFCGEKLRAGQ